MAVIWKPEGLAPQLIGGLIFFLLPGGIAVFMALSGEGMALCPAFFSLIGLILLGQAFATWLARSAFEVASVVAQGPALIGGPASFLVTLAPKRPLDVNPEQCSLELKVRERARYTGGTSSRTYEEVIASTRVSVPVPQRLSAPHSVAVSVRVPPNVPPTWHGKENHFEAIAVFTLPIEKWPDLKLELELVILPEVFRG